MSPVAMKRRLGIPKYGPVWSMCCAAGFGLMVLSRYASDGLSAWVMPLGGLLLATGFGVSVAGSVAERGELRSKHGAQSQ
jgi:hypothetical protein